MGGGPTRWHIQCAAIAAKYLGPVFDIHTGSRELNFPHYENVNAIGEASQGRSPARYWIHSELILVDGQKMSRTAGNAPTLEEVIAQGFHGRPCDTGFFRPITANPLRFSLERLAAAARTLERLDGFAARLRAAAPGRGVPDMDQYIYDLRQGFRDCLDDDLNVAGALSALFAFVSVMNPWLHKRSLSRDNIAQALELIGQIDEVLGIFNFEEEPWTKQRNNYWPNGQSPTGR